MKIVSISDLYNERRAAQGRYSGGKQIWAYRPNVTIVNLGNTSIELIPSAFREKKLLRELQ